MSVPLQSAADLAVAPMRALPTDKPRLGNLVITRPRLIAKLDAYAPLTVLRAPLGFGKTTLLTEWLQTASAILRVGRVRVLRDCVEDDLWNAVLDTLAAIGFTPAERRRENEPSPSLVRRTLAADATPTLLVLDDLDHLEGNEVDGDLLTLLDDLPHLHLVVCVRSGRHFRGARFSDRTVVELGAAQLALTVEETQRLLEATGVETAVPSETAERIQRRTSGWPDLTRALIIQEAGGERPDADLTVDYVLGRLLPVLGGGDRVEFALATALLDRVPAGLAEMYAGDHADSAQQWLRRFEADGVLTSRTAGDGGVVYEWPRVIRDALRHELQRRYPGRARALHSVASGWYLDHERPADALTHATRARDWDLVVRIIETRGPTLLLEHRGPLLDALTAAPLAAMKGSPLALAVRALRLEVADDETLAALPRLPEGTGKLVDLGRAPNAAGTLVTATVVVGALRAAGRWEQAREESLRLEQVAREAATSWLPDVTGRVPHALLQVAITRLLTGDPADAWTPIRRGLETITSHTPRNIERNLYSKLAVSLALTGETREATAALARYDETDDVPGWLGRRIGSTAATARVLGAVDRLDLQTARSALYATPADLEFDEFWAYHAYAAGVFALHNGEAARGLRELVRVRALHRGLTAENSTAGLLLASLEADLQLALGRANHALVALRAAGLGHHGLRVPYARLALVSGDPDLALSIAGDHNWHTRAHSRAAATMQLIKAVAHSRKGQSEAAAGALRTAVDEARVHDLLAPFATVPLRELRQIAAALPEEYQLQMERPALLTAPAVYPEYAELLALTKREQLILSWLATGTRVQDIAAELYISYNTVKGHLRALYGKLGATSRAEAVTAAVALGLLPDSVEHHH